MFSFLTQNLIRKTLENNIFWDLIRLHLYYRWRNMSYETAETVYNIENDKTAIPGNN